MIPLNPAGIGFLGMSLVLVLSAVWTVTGRKPVYSVIGLLVHFSALAAMYITLSAEFLGVVQIIVYSGAILVLFLFVIALLSSGVAPFSLGPNRMPWATIPAAALVFVTCIITIVAVGRIPSGAPTTPIANAVGVAGTANAFGSVADFGKALFTVHLLPFEITAFILMVAVIGVILLAGDQTPYMPSRRREMQVRRDAREAILRGGEE